MTKQEPTFDVLIEERRRMRRRAIAPVLCICGMVIATGTAGIVILIICMATAPCPVVPVEKPRIENIIRWVPYRPDLHRPTEPPTLAQLLETYPGGILIMEDLGGLAQVFVPETDFVPPEEVPGDRRQPSTDDLGTVREPMPGQPHRPADQTVYTAPDSGKRYHTSQACPALQNARHITAMSHDAALRNGYTPCRRCAHPPPIRADDHDMQVDGDIQIDGKEILGSP